VAGLTNLRLGPAAKPRHDLCGHEAFEAAILKWAGKPKRHLHEAVISFCDHGDCLQEEIMRYGLFFVLVLSLLGSMPAHALHEGRFSFALIGDVPYRDDDIPRLDRVLAAINQDREVRWTIHTGDIKSGSSPCSDAVLQARFLQLSQLHVPLVYTPGDNEWTDCHRSGFVPLERLAMVRGLFFPAPGRTLGSKPMAVVTQAGEPSWGEFVENVRWKHQGVIFATLHVVGSHNALDAFPGRAAADDEEVSRRSAAAIAWLRETFAVARRDRARGVFLAMQADMALEAPAGSPDRLGFGAIVLALEQETLGFPGVTWLAHGDSHLFRLDKPLHGSRDGRLIESFSRIENFGDLDVHWVRITVDPDDPEVFSAQARMVPQNVIPHPLP
jgi:hypothetical protein